MTAGLRRLLVIDDDDLILQSLKMTLPDPWSMSGVSALRDVPQDKFDAAFVDLHLSGNAQVADGLKVIQALSKSHPHLEIVAISGDLDRNLMESCLKAGASRFLAKPLNPQEVHLILGKIEALLLLQDATLRASNEQLAWIGDSDASREVRRQIASLRGEAGPILVEGDSGTGKEIVTRLIHNQEVGRPMLTLNVSALPENLFESEFFGHTRGAFTGADQNKMGLAEAAHGGDLFLDEIEALPLSLQAKLLRFLESGEVRRVGGKETIKVDVRVIAATNQNLEKLAKEGRFREDLLWRLSGKKILLPPLKDRPQDIEQLAPFFLHQEKPRRNKTFSSDAIDVLKAYNWPGNVRELRRVIEQVSLTSPLPIIRGEDLTPVLKPLAKTGSSMDQIDLSKGLGPIMAELEQRIILQALEQFPDVDEAARLLDISRSSLYKKIKDYNIELRS